MYRAIALALLLATPAEASETVRWIGAGLTDNWTNPNNWLFLNGPDNPGSDRVWFMGDRARTYSDVNEDFKIFSLEFDYDDPIGLPPISRNYVVGGTGVLTLRDVINRTNLMQVVTAPIRLDTDGSFVTMPDFTGALVFGAVDLANNTLRTTASAGGIHFNGPITGSGPLTGIRTGSNGTGVTRFNAASSWSGTLSVFGTVEYAFSEALGSPDVDVNLSGILRRTTTGTNALDVAVVDTGTLDVPTGLTVTHTGTFTSAGGTLVKTGAGTLVLTNTVSGLGHAHVAAGRMRLESFASLSNTAVTIAAGASLQYTRASEDVYTSLAGAGTLQLGGGGRVQVGSGATHAGAGRFDGVIQGTSGGFAKSGIGSFELRGSSSYGGGTTVQAGTLLLNNTAGSATGTGSITVDPNSTLGGDGAAAGAVTLHNLATLAPSDRNAPGLGLGSLAVGGLQMHPGSVLQIELGPNGTSDLLTVNGDAVLNGTLALSRLGNASLGDTLSRRILSTTGALSGSFQAISGREQSATDWFAVVFSAQAIDVVRASAGDASLDGRVDYTDLLRLAQNFGQTSGRTWLSGDFTGDGATDHQDLMLTALNYAPAPGASFEQDWQAAQAALVPEPPTLLLLAAGAAWLALRHRRVQPARA